MTVSALPFDIMLVRADSHCTAMTAGDFGTPLYGLVLRLNAEIMIVPERYPEEGLGVGWMVERSFAYLTDTTESIGGPFPLLVQLAPLTKVRNARPFLVPPLPKGLQSSYPVRVPLGLGGGVRCWGSESLSQRWDSSQLTFPDVPLHG